MNRQEKINIAVVDSQSKLRKALFKIFDEKTLFSITQYETSEKEAWNNIFKYDPDVVIYSYTNSSQDVFSEMKSALEITPRPVIVLCQSGLSTAEQLKFFEAGIVAVIPFEEDLDTLRWLSFKYYVRSKVLAYASIKQPVIKKLPHIQDSHQSDIDSELSIEEAQDIIETIDDEDEDILLESDLQPSIDNDLQPLEEDIELLEDIAGKSVSLNDVFPKNYSNQRVNSVTNISNQSRFSLKKPNIFELHNDGKKEKHSFHNSELIILSAETSGLPILQNIIRNIPGNTNKAFIVVINLPNDILKLFAERMDRDSMIRVSIAKEGDPIRPATVLISPSDSNIGMVRTGRKPKALIRLLSRESDFVKTPSANVPLRASASIYGSSSVAILISGIGTDGVQGIETICNKGGFAYIINPEYAAVTDTNRRCLKLSSTTSVTPQEVINMLTDS